MLRKLALGFLFLFALFYIGSLLRLDTCERYKQLEQRLLPQNVCWLRLGDYVALVYDVPVECGADKDSQKAWQAVVAIESDSNTSLCWHRLADYVNGGSDVPVECQADKDSKKAWQAISTMKSERNTSLCWHRLADYVALGSNLPMECQGDKDLQKAWQTVARMKSERSKSMCWHRLADYVTGGSDIPAKCLNDPALQQARKDMNTIKLEMVRKMKSEMHEAQNTLAATKADMLQKETSRKPVQEVVRKQDGPKVFVGVLTGPAEAKRREIWRNDWECGQQLEDAGIPYKFILGWPVDNQRSLTKKDHGLKPSDSEALLASQLRNESAEHEDLAFFHFPDVYLGLQTKTFTILSYGYSLGANYVVKLDDDACMNASQLLLGIAVHEARVARGGPAALYAGAVLRQGTEYHGMKGKDGSSHPYFTGLGYMLSYDLIQIIINDDKMNTVLWAPYGSFDEDTQTGRWVAFAEEHHNTTVDWMLLDDVMSNSTHTLPGVVR
eukprot:s2555_g10.t2